MVCFSDDIIACVTVRFYCFWHRRRYLEIRGARFPHPFPSPSLPRLFSPPFPPSSSAHPSPSSSVPFFPYTIPPIFSPYPGPFFYTYSLNLARGLGARCKLPRRQTLLVHFQDWPRPFVTCIMTQSYSFTVHFGSVRKMQLIKFDSKRDKPDAYGEVFLYISYALYIVTLHTVLLHFTLWGVVGRLGSGLGLKSV